MKNENFNIFIPISKSIKSDGEHGRFVKGWASVPKEDRDGDIILPRELDISMLMRKGYINYEHKKGGKYKLGVPTDKSYVDPERGFFLEAKLFDNNPYADKMWDLAERINSGEVVEDDDHMLGFSVEARFSHRDYDDPRVLRNVMITNVALTTHPANTSASWTKFEKSFTTGDSIVQDGDTGGQVFRVQSFARDIRELSYRLKDFTVSDWKSIAKSLDEEGRFDPTVAKVVNLMYKSAQVSDGALDMFSTFSESLSQEINFVKKGTDEEMENENTVEKSAEEVVETETVEAQPAPTPTEPEAPVDETPAEPAATEPVEEPKQDEAEVPAEPVTEAPVEKVAETQAEPVAHVGEPKPEVPAVEEVAPVVEEQPIVEATPDTDEPVAEKEKVTEKVVEEVKGLNDKLSDKIAELENKISSLQEELKGKVLDIPEVTEAPVEEAPARKEPEAVEDVPVEERPAIEEVVVEEDEKETPQPEEPKVSAQDFLEKVEEDLPSIRTKLMGDEFTKFSNALRHLRNGNPTPEDGAVLKETLRTVDLRSKVQ